MSLSLSIRHKDTVFQFGFPDCKTTRWSDVVGAFKSKSKITNNVCWGFEYYDDEGDLVMGKSESEWRAALVTAGAKSNGTTIFNIELFSLGHYELGQGIDQAPVMELSNLEIKSSTSSCCPPKQTSTSSCCTPKQQTSCCTAPCKPIINEQTKPCCPENADNKPCCFPCKRPLPDDVPITEDDNEPLQRITNPTLSDYKYSGDALRAVALPLGPIGQGNIAIAGDGGLRQWQISNKVNHNAIVPDSFFAVRFDTVDATSAVVLQSNALYDDTSFKPAAYITDHVVPAASKQLLTDLPGVDSVEVTAKYPTVEVDYMSTKVPLPVNMMAYNPKIPLESSDSAIPFLALEFTVTNTTSQTIDVTMLGTLQNIAGWNGTDVIAQEVCAAGYGGNINSLYTNRSQYGINMSNPSLCEKEPFNGEVALTVLKAAGDETSCMLQFDSAKDMWSHFTGSGLPGQGLPGPSPIGKTWNGAVANKRSLASGASTTFTYFLAWRFPNRYRDWQLFEHIPNTDIYLGNQYNTKYKTVAEVIEYANTNLDRLRSTTLKFRDAMFNSTLPWQVIDSAAGRISVLNSTSCMWHEDGNFFAFEGCSTNSGCCPLNCTHVWNYEMCLSRMYPDLERNMRSIDLLHQINPYGVVPSRSACPIEMRRIWTTWKDYTVDNSSTNICFDGEIGTVLKAYREIRQGASKDWFNQVWPSIIKIMKRWLNELDNGTGVIFGPQPNTYDTTMYGANTFIGCLYLCALRAAEEMAKLQADLDFANLCRDRFMIGSVTLDKLCFTNGKYYTQAVDPKHAVEIVSDGSFVDALYGQWWAHSLGLGYLLPKEHIQSSLNYTFFRNYIESFDPATQKPRHFFDRRDSGLVICYWDEGPPANRLQYTTECAWSGILYSFIGLCLYENLTNIAIKALTDVRGCYDGTRRSPWNEIECGDHYTRPMSSFILMEIGAGQTWTLEKDSSVNLGFAPVFDADSFRSFFILGSCWGQYTQTISSSSFNAKLTLDYGTVDLASFNVAHASASTASVLIDSQVVKDYQIEKVEGKISVKFNTYQTLKAGQTLYVSF